ncbi:choice-of-anchor M domain-containing protein [Gardnerella vaginalis]|uniref:choice-of-anchor M domain-containing protein n=1 Tax=Gardnerella TaxID=2701 RepID=UPI000C7BB297|nr:choice-of-anchor M domain-containing protein [Gardnerella vaginalis]PKZ45838.1 cell surface protein [Gardnerella vaginalis]UQA84713.1 choice-of-anchor M domain-containing protein [Gardnerella vaginalis]
MTQVIKNMVKRAFAMCGVAVLAFAVLVSGFSAALPAVALENGNPAEKYDPTKKEVLSHGHTDVFYPIQYNGKFIMAVEKDAATFLKPENTTLRVAKSTYTTKSQLPALATEYYYLDSSGNQKGNPLFPGWDTGYAASLVGASHADDATADIAIQQVTGPMNGRILLWTTDGIGKNSKKLSFEENDLDDEPDTDGSRFMLPGVIHQHTAGHVHANWGFTQPGVYKLKVAATITNKNTKKQITTEPAEYTFEVEDTYSGEVPVSGITETLDLHRRGDFINPDDDEEAHEASKDHKDTDKDDGGDMRIGNIRDSGPHPHYHSYEGYGGLDLKVVNKPKGARIEWRYVRADEGPDAYGTTLFAERLQLPAEPAMNKMKVYAHATEGETQVGKDTASATIAVEDHGADGHPVVKAIAPYKRFKPGDTLHAKTVLLNPHVATDGVTGAPIDDPTSPVTSIVKDYVWLMKKEGESEFKRIPGAVNSKLELKLDASMQGATIRPSLVLKNGELYRNKMFDEFCDYVIEMKGVPHSHNHDGDDDQSGSDSEDDENPHGKKRHEKRHNNRHNKRKNKTKHFAGGKNFLKGVFGGAANSGLFGSSSNGGFQFESNFFKKSGKKLKRAKNNRNKTNRNKTNRNNRKNNPKNNTQSGASSGSSSFTRTENSSGTSLHNSSRRTSDGTHTKNKSSKKSGQTIRNFVRTDNNSGNKSKNSSVNNSDFVKSNERHALQGARQYNEESDETYEDDSDDIKGDSSSIKWIAVAASGASVGLCTITGACGALVRPRLKLL